jgi:hypothetical protein
LRAFRSRVYRDTNKKPIYPEVGKKKHDLNKSQRTFKLKSSPTNLSSLIKAEEEYIEAKEAALEKWSENICANINNARNIKDKWMEFRKFFTRKSNNTILPFKSKTVISALVSNLENMLC